MSGRERLRCFDKPVYFFYEANTKKKKQNKDDKIAFDVLY